MTTQTLERPVGKSRRNTELKIGGGDFSTLTQPRVNTLPADFDIDAELAEFTNPPSDSIPDSAALGQRIMQSAMADERSSFAVKCRSVRHATEFATPMRSLLIALTSGFGGISATISPSLNLNTWPAMDELVSALEESGAGELWQPIGERSIGVGAARHVFVSVDNPIRDDATRVFPNLLVDVVGAHLIDPDWFDRVVAPRCLDRALTFVYYGQAGFEGSLFERAWEDCQYRGNV